MSVVCNRQGGMRCLPSQLDGFGDAKAVTNSIRTRRASRCGYRPIRRAASRTLRTSSSVRYSRARTSEFFRRRGGSDDFADFSCRTSLSSAIAALCSGSGFYRHLAENTDFQQSFSRRASANSGDRRAWNRLSTRDSWEEAIPSDAVVSREVDGVDFGQQVGGRTFILDDDHLPA